MPEEVNDLAELEKRLAEATALLKRWVSSHGWDDPERLRATTTFLTEVQPSAEPDLHRLLAAVREFSAMMTAQSRKRSPREWAEALADLLQSSDNPAPTTETPPQRAFGARVPPGMLGKTVEEVRASADLQPISDETLRHLRECALAWEPEACLLGNVTAHQLRSFCLELARLRREAPTPADRAVLDSALAFVAEMNRVDGDFDAARSEWDDLDVAVTELRLHEVRRAVKEGV